MEAKPMKRYPDGFNAMLNNYDRSAITEPEEIKGHKKSIVQVYFPHRGMDFSNIKGNFRFF